MRQTPNRRSPSSNEFECAERACAAALAPMGITVCWTDQSEPESFGTPRKPLTTSHAEGRTDARPGGRAGGWDSLTWLERLSGRENRGPAPPAEALT